MSGSAVSIWQLNRSLHWKLVRSRHKCSTVLRRPCPLWLLLASVLWTVLLTAWFYHAQPQPNKELPTIWVITATYKRLEQRSELTRLCNTLVRVPKLHWVVAEDANAPSDLVRSTLSDCGLPFTHLHALTPASKQLKSGDPFWLHPKGVLQRNAALDWLRSDPNRKGVVYIADDDNTYDVRVFDEMRWTRSVSVWPVGFAGGLPYEGIRCSNGRVLGWIVGYKSYRPFPIDMAGFAINLRLLHSRPHARLSYNAEIGFQESLLLAALGVRLLDLEAKADDCQRILVWHTRTSKPRMTYVAQLAARGLTLPPILGYL